VVPADGGVELVVLDAVVVGAGFDNGEGVCPGTPGAGKLDCGEKGSGMGPPPCKLRIKLAIRIIPCICSGLDLENVRSYPVKAVGG
jgi:hypothetical protein